MSYKRPNNKGPRVRVGTARVMDSKALTRFKQAHPEHKELTLAGFNAIVKQFHNNIVDKVIEEPNGVLLPRRLGRLIVMSFPTKRGKVIDFGASNREGRKVYHANHDTDNRMCKLMFVRELGVQVNLEFWKFKATDAFASRVSKAFLKFWPRYIYVDSKIHVTKILRQ